MHIRSIAAMGSTLAAAAALTLGLSPADAASNSSSWQYTTNPHVVASDIHATTPAALPSPAQCLATYELSCNTVTSERAAYGIPAEIDGKPAGTGTTIAIVDVYGSPTVQHDLDVFSATMGIPSTKVNITYPTGKVTYPTDTKKSWATETSLDVQWAHALAPGATIDLVIASSPYGNVVNKSIQAALDLHPDTLSMSFANYEGNARGISGDNLQYQQAQKMFAAAAASGTTSFAAAGDWGSDNGLGFANADYPASDQNVVAVGGTNLFKNVDPTEPAETTWGDYSACPFTCAYGPIGATGGAPSRLTGKPGNDVSMNASVYTSVLVYESWSGEATWSFVGGTSSSTPQWAAITADLNQAAGHKLGDIRPLLAGWASSGALYDVTRGDNTSPTFAGGFSAGAGWDIPTGYGTPVFPKLVSRVSRG